MTRVTLRLPATLIAWINGYSTAKNRSMSSVIRQAIHDYCEAHHDA